MRRLPAILSFGLACGCSAILGVSDVPPASTTSGDAGDAGDGVPRIDAGAEAGAEAGTQTGAGDASPEGGANEAATGAPAAPTDVAADAVTLMGSVSTLAGSGAPAFADGTGAAASFNNPRGVALDAAGNVFLCDADNHRVRRVSPAGVVKTIAGSGTPADNDGTGATASFHTPRGIVVDAAGDLIVSDSDNNRIKKVTVAGVVTTLAGSGDPAFADGKGLTAKFNKPVGVALDTAGNLYIADMMNNRVRKMTPDTTVTTIAGSGSQSFSEGTGAAASFSNPYGIAVDSAGTIYVADTYNHRIRKVTAGVVVTTLAGSGTEAFLDGAGAAAQFDSPEGIAVDPTGNLYIGDTANNRVRRITPAGLVTTLAGEATGVFADDPRSFHWPYGVAVQVNGDIYLSDEAHFLIRKIAPVGRGQIAVRWSAPSAVGSSPISGYVASASAGGGPAQTCSTTGATSCTIDGLKSGVTYAVSVIATNAAGPGEPSSPLNAVPN